MRALLLIAAAAQAPDGPMPYSQAVAVAVFELCPTLSHEGITSLSRPYIVAMELVDQAAHSGSGTTLGLCARQSMRPPPMISAAPANVDQSGTVPKISQLSTAATSNCT